MPRRPSVRAPQTYPVKKGEIRLVSVDMQGVLGPGETMTGTPAVDVFLLDTDTGTLSSSAALTISDRKLNAAEIAINGQPVPISKGVECMVNTTNGVVGKRYVLVITAITNSTPAQTIKREVPIDIVQ
jgi:hypothetical protein